MSPQDHLRKIGHALVARRTTLDPARHRTRTGWMATVAATVALSKRVIIDIETGARSNYATDTIAALETVYRLRSGSLQHALEGTGQLTTESGTVLFPHPDEPEPTNRIRSEERLSRLSGEVWRIVHDLEADTEGIPDQVAEEMLQRAIANAEAQARIMLDAERNRWERQQEKAESDPEEDQT